MEYNERASLIDSQGFQQFYKRKQTILSEKSTANQNLPLNDDGDCLQAFGLFRFFFSFSFYSLITVEMVTSMGGACCITIGCNERFGSFDPSVSKRNCQCQD